MFYSFVTKHAYHGHTDGRTDRITIPDIALAFALRCKNLLKPHDDSWKWHSVQSVSRQNGSDGPDGTGILSFYGMAVAILAIPLPAPLNGIVRVKKTLHH